MNAVGGLVRSFWRWVRQQDYIDDLRARVRELSVPTLIESHFDEETRTATLSIRGVDGRVEHVDPGAGSTPAPSATVTVSSTSTPTYTVTHS